jgi:uncharacterized protein (TIGR02453 family)
MLKAKDRSMPFTGFPPETFAFLKGLAKNNRKDWFEAHREDYENYHLAPAKAFVEAIAPGLRKISKSLNAEPKVNGSIFRINRDVRFAKDKRPYKTTLDLWFWEGEKRGWEAPGFYLRLMPDGFVAGAGLHTFTPDQLKRYRAAVLNDKAGGELLKTIAKLDSLKLGEATRKKMPRGLPADHPRAPVLLLDGLYCTHEAPLPKAVHKAEFIDLCLGIFTRAHPLSVWLGKYVTGKA